MVSIPLVSQLATPPAEQLGLADPAALMDGTLVLDREASLIRSHLL
ncbi:hypothetical protein [Thermogemmatispora onikobensis]|nr:hypothetical protein [Thermogemmatispora onikobensis]